MRRPWLSDQTKLTGFNSNEPKVIARYRPSAQKNPSTYRGLLRSAHYLLDTLRCLRALKMNSFTTEMNAYAIASKVKDRYAESQLHSASGTQLAAVARSRLGVLMDVTQGGSVARKCANAISILSLFP